MDKVKNLGFTMIEMLVTIAILAIVLSIGVPSFKSILRSSAMASNCSDMISAFNYARIEAVKRGTAVKIGQLDGATWHGGVVVWIDSDGDNTFDSGESLRLWESFDDNTTVISSGDLSGFTFYASGEVDAADVLTLCDDRTAETGRTVSILASGAIYAEETTCA